MKRTLFFCAIIGAFAAASAACAGNDNPSENRTTHMVGIGIDDILDPVNKDRPKKKRKFGKIGQLIEKFKQDKQEQNLPPKPIDPGIGNGQPLAPEVPTRPGYVWVGDHWERERAPKKNGNNQPPMTADPNPVVPQGKPGYVWVGDHWERVRANSTNVGTPTVVGQPTVGPVVRDHRTPTFGQSGAVVRDHRTPQANVHSSSGGATVTSRPRPQRPSSNVMTSSSPLDGVVDGFGNIGDALGDALGAAGNAVGIGHGSITPVAPSKPVYKAPPSATVRDHRK